MSAPTLDQRFAEAMGQLLGPDFPSTIGLAVSGGGDSMAMLALARVWARVWGVSLHVATVDHGLRRESAAEAEMVAQECALLDIPHDTLRWTWDGTGNVQAQARQARLALLGDWAPSGTPVLMAHTKDDQAETVLLRLARGSGVEGLSGMPEKRQVSDGFTILRPCLSMTRAELRHYAQSLRVPWVEDPSNEDPRFDRVRARALLPALADLGADSDRLVETAKRMKRAATALRARMLSVAEAVVLPSHPALAALDRDEFAAVEEDTQLRLLAAALQWASGAAYRPRANALEEVLHSALSGGSGTLHGAKIETSRDRILVFRELSAARALAAPFVQGMIWDGGWQIDGPSDAGLRVDVLGESLSDVSDWRDLGVPRACLMATPAIWKNDTLISAPALDDNTPWTARIVTPFSTYLVCH